MSDETTKLSHAEAIAALSEVSPFGRLTDINLYSSSTSPSGSNDTKLGHRIRVLYKHFEGLDHGALVEYEMTHLVRHADDSDADDSMHLTISARFEARFDIDESDLDQRKIEAFVRTSGVFQTWPYWREFMPSMACRHGCAPETILDPLPISVAAHIAGYRNPEFDKVSQQETDDKTNEANGDV